MVERVNKRWKWAKQKNQMDIGDLCLRSFAFPLFDVGSTVKGPPMHSSLVAFLRGKQKS